MRRLLGGILLFAGLAAARETVIFDTDCGLFGDDGASLVMLLRSPSKVSIAAITMVPGNVWSAQGAEYIFHILDLVKRPMAVYTGAETPLLHTTAMAREEARRWGPLEFSGAFATDPNAVVPAPGAKLTGRQARPGAIERLISEIERHPGEITIFAVGPLTNIALALRLRPEIETKIKQIVMMGGNVRSPGNASPSAEFNFWFDAEAARLVLRSRIPKKILFDLDICNRALLRKPQFDEIAAAQTPVTELFREDYGNRYPGFLQHPDVRVPLWDVLCAAWLLDPGSVTRAEQRYLDVQSAWGRFYGATIPLDRRQAPNATPVTLMLDLDYQRTYKLYRDLLTEKE
ncbi:MAG TPA: nucleoside hydrolase [Bryobacteraceae bacterium]|nr:nucleoside hydrolase [Bryobacteraceae bacterium]